MSTILKPAVWLHVSSIVCMAVSQELFLTFLFGARVDDFGGNYMDRVYKHLQVVLGMIYAYNASHDTEVLIVEWNPIPGRSIAAALKNVLRKAKPESVASGSPSPLRIVTVPGALSQSYGFHSQSHERLDLPPFNDLAAKNAGGRRARGRFLLVTNPDDLPSRQLGSFLFRRQGNSWQLDHDPNAFYVIGMRNDLLSGHQLPGTDFSEILTLAERRVATDYRLIRTSYELWILERPESVYNYHKYNYTHLHGHHCTGNADFMGYVLKHHEMNLTAYEESISTAPVLDAYLGEHDPKIERMRLEGPLWGFQAGDFILVATSAFHRARGFIDIPAQAHGSDDALLYKFRAANMTQRVLLPPCFIVHQHHPRAARLAGFVDPTEIKRVSAKDPYGLRRLHPLQTHPRLWGIPARSLPDQILPWP